MQSASRLSLFNSDVALLSDVILDGVGDYLPKTTLVTILQGTAALTGGTPFYLAAAPLPFSWHKERRRPFSREASPGLTAVFSITV